MNIFNELKTIENEFIKIRHKIHENPELGFCEFKTQELVISKLKDFGYEVHSNIAKTGVVGVLKKGTSNKSIALRADMDALCMNENSELSYKSANNNMHACGHDGHTASLLMAAKYLSTKEFNGTLNLIFQPAEECCDDDKNSGAMKMIQEGLFDKFKSDYVFSYHNMPALQVPKFKDKTFLIKKGAMLAGVMAYMLTFKGVGGHASTPHLCKCPISALNNFINMLNTYKALELDSNKPSVINVTGVFAGNMGAYNIVPDSANLMINVRAFDNEMLKAIDIKINDLAKSIENAFGVEVIVEQKEFIKATINNDEAYEFAYSVAKNLFGEENCTNEIEHIMGSEDFSAMLDVTKGAYAFINNNNSANLHNPKYDYDDSILILASAYYSKLVLEYLK